MKAIVIAVLLFLLMTSSVTGDSGLEDAKSYGEIDSLNLDDMSVYYAGDAEDNGTLSLKPYPSDKQLTLTKRTSWTPSDVLNAIEAEDLFKDSPEALYDLLEAIYCISLIQFSSSTDEEGIDIDDYIEYAKEVGFDFEVRERSYEHYSSNSSSGESKVVISMSFSPYITMELHSRDLEISHGKRILDQASLIIEPLGFEYGSIQIGIGSVW